MTSNQPTGKTPTSETTRVPSNVPNDYDHLGVPASLNMPLNTQRRRRAQAHRRRGMPNWAKAVIAMSGGVVAFGIVMLVIFIIAFPPFFRNLEPRYQQRLIDIFPPFESLRPTVPFEVLPTLGGGDDSDAAQQLLMTQSGTTLDETSLPQAGQIDQGDDPLNPLSTPTPTVTPAPTGDDGGIPIGMADTPTPTPLPVYVSPTPNAPALPTWTPVAVSALPALPKQVKLSNVKYEMQGWNNCGPTTMTMALSYYGWQNDQYTAARWMKPHTEDKNVSPWQMVRFVNENTGVKGLYRYGGNVELIKRLLAANFPVMVEKGIQPAGEGWMGHYVLLVGYDDYQQHFLTFDSFLGYNQGDGRPSPYSTFDEWWRHFNRVFLVIYEPSREMELRQVLGEYVDPGYGYEMALNTARAEADKQRDDKWAWFNMGTSYVLLKQYDNAAIAFDQALQLGLPFRMLWYQFGPYEAYFNIGDYNNVRALANNVIATTKYVEESYYWKGMAYAAEGNTSAAVEQFNMALTYNRNFSPAAEAKAAVESGSFALPTVALSGP